VLRQILLRVTPYDDFASLGRGLGISLAAAVFMTLSGAFGSIGLQPAARFGYWSALLIGGYLWGSFVANLAIRRTPDVLWQRILIITLLLTASLTVVVAVLNTLAFGAQFELADIPTLMLSVFMVSLGMTTLNVLVETRRSAVTHATPAPPKFLERLPLKLRGAEVWAVEAEDHYLRLHTSKGQDLILLRLADAVAELEGIEGAQVHRSWWVARDAITDAKRGDGRATLTLKDGAEVPVSRTYAGVLRERGWI
jgi:hypothetical protein